MKLILNILFQTVIMTTFAQLKPIRSGVYHWNDLPVKKEAQRESRKILEGSTTEFEYFEVHATTQYPGATPRPPHAQDSLEEVIIIKEGFLWCTIGDKTEILGPNSVLLIPPHELQSFVNKGDRPVTYYVFMFRSRKPMDMERSANAGGTLMINHDTITNKEVNNRGTKKYFDRPTAMTERYEMHITHLKLKGPSHAAHTHVETEIILMISGETEMVIDGKTYKAGPGDFYIMESGKLHGVANASDKPCSYFAFKWR